MAAMYLRKSLEPAANRCDALADHKKIWATGWLSNRAHALEHDDASRVGSDSASDSDVLRDESDVIYSGSSDDDSDSDGY